MAVFRRAVDGVEDILFLADNAGEIVFDGLLLALAVFAAIDDDGTEAPTPGDGTAPAQEAPADTQAPAEG